MNRRFPLLFFASILLISGILGTRLITPRAYAQLAVDSSTSALWHIDEGTGSITYDATTNNNDGTISGATWTTGKFSSALYFHGGGQFFNGDDVTVPNSPSLNINGPFTVEAWIKAKGTDNYLAIVDKYYSDQVSINNGFTLHLSTGRIRLSIYSGTTGKDIIGTTDLRDDNWHHVAGVWDGSHGRVYVDKTLEGEAPWTSPPASTTSNLGIGKRLSGWGGYMPFLGTIDEVRISTIARDGEFVINVPADYPTIQGAVDAAFPNNIIHVWNGTYFENVVVTTSNLKLIGQSSGGTIIDGMGAGNVLLVTNTANVSIMGFTLTNSGGAFPLSGIYINYSLGIEVWQNDLWGNTNGIMMDHCFDSNIRGNDIHENGYGIWSMDSGSTNIVANNIMFNMVLNVDSNNCTNTFYYNNLANPSPGQVDEWGPLRSLWDDGGVYPCPICTNPQDRGNHWSDYTGLDNGLGPLTPSGHKCANDKVGDTFIPHQPTTGSPPTDWYPLMNWWTAIGGDIDLDGDVDIFDVVIMCGCYASSWSDSNWDPRCDLAPIYGKIDIYDIVTCTANYGRNHLQ